MSEAADIIEDYRQHTRWNGPQDARVAREVPPDVIKAIVAYETVRELRATWNERYTEDREQASLDLCAAYGWLMDQWWRKLQALLSMEPGWYPHNGWIYGYAKRGKDGFRLVREPGSESIANPERAAAYERGEREKERGERQLTEFCAAHNESRGTPGRISR